MEWAQYRHALHVQLSWWQVIQPKWRVSLDNKFDRTWVNSLVRLHACTGANLMELDQSEREELVGHVNEEQNTSFFGNLQNARFTAAVLRNPRSPNHVNDATVLDQARGAARSFRRRPVATQVMGPWMAIAALKSFDSESACRLLLSERADLYLMLNRRSSTGLGRIANIAIPKKLQMPKASAYYREILQRVYASPWWQSKPARVLKERLIWNNRVALLDVFAYDVDGSRFG